MPRDTLKRIREQVHLRQYDMTAHAMEEMFTSRERYLIITVYEVTELER